MTDKPEMTDDPKGGDAPKGTDAPKGGDDPKADEGGDDAARTFTKDDLDRAVAAVVARERKRFADYDDLKAKAGESATLEDRVAAMEKRATEAESRAMRADIANEFGIDPEDRDLFLLGTDEETVTAQAKRLAARTSETKKKPPVDPDQGRTPNPPKADDRRATADGLWAQMS